MAAAQAERRAGKAVLHEQLAARAEQRLLAAEALAREREAIAAQATPALTCTRSADIPMLWSLPRESSEL